MKISKKLARQYRDGIRAGNRIVAFPKGAIWPERGTAEYRAAKHTVYREIDRLAKSMRKSADALNRIATSSSLRPE